MNVFLNILILLGAAVFWEAVAWFMHKYVMHGFGWYLHQDHHVSSGRRFQRNDAYALFFALCSFLLIYFGLKSTLPPVWHAGLGVALYGIGYVGFHDIMFHKRFKKVTLNLDTPYIRRIIKAHRVHHGTVTRNGATSFSFLWAPQKYSPQGNLGQNT